MSEDADQWTFLEEFRYCCGNGDNVALLEQFVSCAAARTLPEAFREELDGEGRSPYELNDLVSSIGPERTTALHCACANGCLGNAKFLVERLHAPVRANASGNTPLHWAAQNGHAEVVSWLIKSFPDLDVLEKNAFGRSALAMAFESQNEECVMAVLHSDSAINLVPEDEREADMADYNDYNEQHKSSVLT